MSASSASSLARGADIIDLDRYMRSSVRPSNPRHARERLVVDAGGAGRVPVGTVGSGTDSGRRVGRGTDSGRRVGGVGRGTGSERERSKRYWHDSGLSDSSYGQSKPRAHRRSGEAPRRQRACSGARAAVSQASARQFRAACERALRDQQQQIQRVAQLCQMLIQPPASQGATTLTLHPDATLNNKHAPNTEQIDAKTPNDATLRVQKLLQDAEVSLPESYDVLKSQSKKNFGQNVSPGAPRRRRQESDSSDVTSSSSGDERKKDRHRTESCKTYNIIISKLDELGRLFAARRHASVAPAGGIAPAAAKRDQVVATEPDADTVQVMHARRADTRCRVTRVHELDIAPSCERSEGDAHSGAGWRSDASALSDAQPYDVDNPLRLYAQARRLQALRASPRRARHIPLPDKLGDQSADMSGDMSGDKLRRCVCALCRDWWRAVRRCVSQRLSGCC